MVYQSRLLSQRLLPKVVLRAHLAHKALLQPLRLILPRQVLQAPMLLLVTQEHHQTRCLTLLFHVATLAQLDRLARLVLLAQPVLWALALLPAVLQDSI
jgi:hypothetical protein